MDANGWTLYLHPLFQQQLEKLTAQVEALQAKDPLHFKEQSATKLLATINRHMREIIPPTPMRRSSVRAIRWARTIANGSGRNSTSVIAFSFASPAKRK
jgi:hypothetical protein